MNTVKDAYTQRGLILVWIYKNRSRSDSGARCQCVPGLSFSMEEERSCSIKRPSNVATKSYLIAFLFSKEIDSSAKLALMHSTSPCRDGSS